MRTRRPMYLGIKLSKAEDRAIIRLAQREGLLKSAYARRILRAHLAEMGAITIYNPTPEAQE